MNLLEIGKLINKPECSFLCIWAYKR